MKHKIAIVGSKGIPASYGGYETFAEEISAELVHAGHDVVVVGEFRNENDVSSTLGVKVLFSKYIKSKNPIMYYHDSIQKAVAVNCSKIIVCGVGGVFSAFLFQRKVDIYVNPDGLGFRRSKWSKFKRKALYFQYWFCARYIDKIIADSLGIAKYFESKFDRNKGVYVAEYGAKLPRTTLHEDRNNLTRYGLHKNSYAICVARIEPENNIDLILDGFVKYSRDYNDSLILVIVGNTNTNYAKQIILKYEKSESVRFIGGIYDKSKLKTLRESAAIAFHGHSVGGTNPSLLEAMLSKVPIIAHDNDFNREVLDDKGYFFRNKIEIVESLNKRQNSSFSEYCEYHKNRVLSHYSWKEIARKYLEILSK